MGSILVGQHERPIMLFMREAVPTPPFCISTNYQVCVECSYYASGLLLLNSVIILLYRFIVVCLTVITSQIRLPGKQTLRQRFAWRTFIVVYLPDQYLRGTIGKGQGKRKDLICDIVTTKASDNLGGGCCVLLGQCFIMDIVEARGLEYCIHSFPLYNQSLDMSFSQGRNMNFSKEAFFGWGQFSKGLPAHGHQLLKLQLLEE